MHIIKNVLIFLGICLIFIIMFLIPFLIAIDNNDDSCFEDDD